MNELIEIKNENGQQLVSGRDLHEFLGIKTPYHIWMERIIKNYGFLKDIEYTVVNKNVHNLNGGKQYIIDHILTLNMAKQISMVSKGDKTKQIRLYFIKCEEKLKEIIPQVQQKLVNENPSINELMDLSKYNPELANKLYDDIYRSNVIKGNFNNINTSNYITSKELAKRLNIYTLNDTPHGKIIDSIAIHNFGWLVNNKPNEINEYFKTELLTETGYPTVYYSPKACLICIKKDL